MTKKKDENLPRRDFIAKSAKVVAGVSAAVILSKATPPAHGGAGGVASHSEAFREMRMATPDDTDFEVVIIGTGFGAMVAATTLLDAKPDLKLLFVERGVFFFSPERPKPPFLETQPVQYWPRPDSHRGVKDLLAMLQSNILNNPVKPKSSPLMRFNVFDELDILTASGVGGGSLIYSNVTIRPMLDEGSGRYPVMQKHNWPLELNPADYDAATAWMTLKRGPLNKIVTRVPPPEALKDKLAELEENDKYLYLGRSRALREASEKANIAGWSKHKKWDGLDLAVFEYGNKDQNGKGVQTVCERQGRCFIGCLPGARHTLNKTLIDKIFTAPGPHNGLAFPNVKLRTLTDVSHIEFAGPGQYRVWLKDPNKPDKTPSSFLTGRKVIVSAGTLGSTEILLRSQQGARGNLTLSPMIGQRFSSNGDFGAFVTNVSIQNDLPGKDRYHMYPTKGPINTSHVMYLGPDGLQINVEDAGVPQMFAPIVRTTLNLLSLNSTFPAGDALKFFKIMRNLWHGKIEKKDKNWNDPLAPLFPGLPDPSRPESYQTEHEMLQDVFYFNVMGTDEPKGVFSLNKKGRLDLTYHISEQPIYGHIEKVLNELTREMKGKYEGFPLWDGFPRLFPHILSKKATTVHPLGGCPMGNSPSEGVVNTKGQVFRHSPGGPAGQVYDGLYVMDASIIPGPVAVNPTLTIAALTLRLAKQIQF